MNVEELKGKPFTGLIHVAQLLKEPIGSSRSYHAEEIVDEEAKGCVKGKITLIHTRGGILVLGELSIELEMRCSRCLNAFLYPISFTLEEEFLCASNRLPSPEELDNVSIGGDNVLDLGEIIRQNCLLNLPMKRLCRVDCAGINRMSSHGST